MTPDLMAVSRHLEQTLGVAPLIRCNGKAPLDPSWTTGPRSDPVTWRRRLDGHRQNVGMITGAGLLVIDVDLYHPDGEGSYDRLRDLGLPAQTVTAITGGGGRHYLYRVAEDVQSGPLAGFPGIDVKCAGGQVIVAPSVHPDTGRPYEWEHTWGPGDVEPVALPESILVLCRSAGEGVKRELDERDEAAVNLLLEHFGGHHPRTREGWVEVCRPGKDDGASATVGRLGPGTTKVWSSNWPELPVAVYSLHDLRKFAGVAEPTVAAPPLRPPDGYRWWQRSDSDEVLPVLGPDAYHGPVGDFLELVHGETEGHPAPIGFTVLVFVGAWLGRRHRVVLGGINHASNLWGVTVGPTSSGAKGTSAGVSRRLLDLVDPTMYGRLSVSGFGSGQVLVDTVRDRDDGESRKDIVITDAEMAQVFRTCAMSDSTLSETLRKAYDGDPLEWRTIGHGKIVANDHHVSVSGAITPDELRLMLDDTAIRNGLGNRFLFLWSEAGDPLPFGGNVDPVRLGGVARSIVTALGGDIYQRNYAVYRETPFGDEWASWYPAHCHGVDDGVVKVLTARMRVHLPRIAGAYAALDGAGELTVEHFKAARAWCDYGIDTVRRVFGDGVTGRARKLLDAIRQAGTDGLDGTAQRDVFNRNLSGDELATLRDELEDRGHLWTVEVPTLGRPRTLSFAVTRLR